MKKLFNSQASMVDDMIDGFVAAYPQMVARGEMNRLVRRAQPADGAKKVALAIGNGSGHEPIAMGFVGTGLLDANIVGDIFAAPSPDMIYDGLREITGPAGSLLLVSRHEGDVINANAAIMMAEDDGLKVRQLWMYDDISSAPRDQQDQRRGAAGTLFVYKILGAAAETGMALDELVALGEAVRDNTCTLAAAVSPGTSPVTGKQMFDLPADEIFIGMGVHGEPGVGRMKQGPVSALVAHILEKLLDDRPIGKGTPVIVLVNGFGATTLMELLTVYREVFLGLEKHDIPVVSRLVGSLSTTQDTAGFSISLLTPDKQMLEFWQAPQRTPFFPQTG